MKIEGRNLGKKEVEYKLLSQYPYFNDERQELIKKIEEMYLKYREEAKGTEIRPFPKCDNKVVLNPGMINHKCSNSLEALRAISQYGILASEWFGQIESEREGVFCSFVDRIHSEDSSDNRARILNLQRLKSKSNDIVLFFDTTNPVMEQLLHLDYFEYEKVKLQTPEKIDEMYTKDELELFEQIIEPFSPGGKKYHVNSWLPYCDWSAIPGGIPSALVNGICVKNESYDKEYIEEIAKLFPNTTIFNGDLEILHEPEKITQNSIDDKEENTVRDGDTKGSYQEMLNIKNMERNIHIGNSGEMHRYTDDTGKRFLIKPAYRKNSKKIEPFRAYAQQIGYEIQRLIDPDSAVPCYVREIKIDNENVLSSIQEEIEGTDFIKIPGLSIEKLQQYSQQFLREFVTDYLLGNYDSHIENFIVDERGILRGIDKEQSLKYITDEKTEKIDTNFKPNGAGHEPVYNRLFRLYEKGKIDLDLHSIEPYINKVESVPDDIYIQIFGKYVNSRTEDENERRKIFESILHRKKYIRENIEQFINKTEINKHENDRNEENSFKQEMLFFENEIGNSTIGVPLEKKQESLQRVQADYSKEKDTDLIQG